MIISPVNAGEGFHVEGDFVELSSAIARKFGIAHELLNAEQIIERFSMLMPRPQDHGYYEPGAGVLRPERCISTQLDLARTAGATVHFNERVLDYQARAGRRHRDHRPRQLCGGQSDTFSRRLDD